MIRSAVPAVLALTTLAPVTAQSKLPTVEEATEKSQKTGRPILAMAGQKT